MSRIAKSTFTGAPTDKVATVDVYGTTTAEQRNALIPTDSVFQQALPTKLAPIPGANQNTEGRVDLADGRKRLMQTLKGGRSNFDSLSEEMKQNLLRNLDGGGQKTSGDPTYAKFLRAESQSGSLTLASSDYNSAKGVAAMLRDLTSSELFEVADLGAEASVLHAAIEEMSKWGVPELIDDVLKDIEDEKLKKEALRRSARTISASGDIDLIEKVIRQVGVSPLISHRPNFPEQVLRSYRFKQGITPSEYPDRLEQLVWVMDRLQPDWFWTTRGEEQVWNLAIIAGASDHARELLLTTEPYRSAILTATFYPKTSTRQLMRSMYPMIALVD